MAQYGKPLVLNLDETSVRVSLLPRKMWNHSNPKDRVHPNVRDTKVYFTAVCIIGADGTRYDPIIIAKGKNDKYGRYIDKLINDGYRIIKYVTSSGWMNLDTMLKTLEYVKEIREQHKTNSPIFLVLDSYKSHVHDIVLKKAEDYNITIIPVPANGTSVYQTLDVGIFGILKQKLRASYREWLQHVNKETKPSHLLQDAVKRFYDAWGQITSEHILKAWDKIPNLKKKYELKIQKEDDIFAYINDIDDYLNSHTKTINDELKSISNIIKTEEEASKSIFRYEEIDNNDVFVDYGLVNHSHLYTDLSVLFNSVEYDKDFQSSTEQSKNPSFIQNSMSKISSKIHARNKKIPDYTGQDSYSDDVDQYQPPKRVRSKKKIISQQDFGQQICNSLSSNSVQQKRESTKALSSFLDVFSENQSESDSDYIDPSINPLSSKNDMVKILTPLPNYTINNFDIILHGFFNIYGKTCYINAYMVVLYHSPIQSFLFSTSLCSEYSESNSLIYELRSLLTRYKNGSPETLRKAQQHFILFLKNDPGFNKAFPSQNSPFEEQQDEGEFITYVINRIHDECFQNNLFESLTYIQTVSIDNAFEQYSADIQPYYNLSLPNEPTTITNVINNNLNFVFNKERPSVIRFTKLPSMITFRLNRHKMKNYEFVKNRINIFLDPYLTFAEFESNAARNYELFAIIIHNGDVHEGHYYTYLKTVQDWYLFDTLTVKKQDSDIFLSSNDIEKDVCFLFYREMHLTN